jgi:hypothetical protein
MTLKEFAAKGGHARAKKLSPERRRHIARCAGLASAKQRAIKQVESCQVEPNGENKV